MNPLEWLLWPSNPLESAASLAFWLVVFILAATVGIVNAASLIGVI